ncbi:hypothetical protein C8F01DRAFT_8844 [Mycena amicta]|nr:hypothetical protein C8F01DRAFT_8844 [Mycena amicta]
MDIGGAPHPPPSRPITPLLEDEPTPSHKRSMRNETSVSLNNRLVTQNPPAASSSAPRRSQPQKSGKAGSKAKATSAQPSSASIAPDTSLELAELRSVVRELIDGLHAEVGAMRGLVSEFNSATQVISGLVHSTALVTGDGSDDLHKSSGDMRDAASAMREGLASVQSASSDLRYAADMLVGTPNDSEDEVSGLRLLRESSSSLERAAQDFSAGGRNMIIGAETIVGSSAKLARQTVKNWKREFVDSARPSEEFALSTTTQPAQLAGPSGRARSFSGRDSPEESNSHRIPPPPQSYMSPPAPRSFATTPVLLERMSVPSVRGRGQGFVRRGRGSAPRYGFGPAGPAQDFE